MFQIMAEAQALERAGRSVIHLEIGDTSSFANEALTRILRDDPAILSSLGYSPSAGETDLRDAFVKQYSLECGQQFSRENVVITPANAAISQLFTVLCDEGDQVMLADPSFPTYQLAARFTGLEPVFFPLREASRFSPNLADIQATLESSPRVRMLVIDNPSNPLGLRHDFTTIASLAAMCLDHGVAFVLDETYKNLVYSTKQPRIPHSANNFYVYTLSKDAAAPALRIGCVVGEPEVIGKIADYNSLFYSCLPKPLQLAAARYLEAGHIHLNILGSAIAERIEVVVNILGTSKKLSFVKPNAAIYVYINIDRTGLTSEEFAVRLLKEHGVCVCPGTGFGPSGSGYVRICLSGDQERLYAGCKLLVNFANATAIGK